MSFRCRNIDMFQISTTTTCKCIQIIPFFIHKTNLNPGHVTNKFCVLVECLLLTRNQQCQYELILKLERWTLNYHPQTCHIRQKNRRYIQVTVTSVYTKKIKHNDLIYYI